ncbi:acyl-CoA thioesterase [Flammeovirgaceae bacterium SG7u.111]|nr:acyl-CoA thioesterase [Flammeovirgaceae bacterium SG7u.132]WPO36163.1 acyl-CoA thioesterase [Flammeovirgaceae bacterium SG7u.111]
MLKSEKKIEVQFHEVDSLRIVWHGHYIKYFETGREAFGKEFGLSYMQVYAQGFLMPVVKVTCDYKLPVQYEDNIVVETTFQNSPAAKVIFTYIIKNKDTGAINATGYSEQVFLTEDKQLHLTIPPFFEEWKKKHGLN